MNNIKKWIRYMNNTENKLNNKKIWLFKLLPKAH